MPSCPKCSAERTVKNGRIHTGKQRFLCRRCGYQFVENPTDKRIDQATRALIDRLLLERLSMAGIARAVQVSEQWLQDYVNCKAAQSAQQAQVQPQKRGLRRCNVLAKPAEGFELWSFVDHKGNKQWVWLALDVETREIIAAQVGNRGQGSAQQLWDALPKVYRHCAVIYTDAWEAYQAVLPSKRHRVVSKESGKKRVAKLVILNASTAPCGSESHALSDVIWPFPRRCAIILAYCGISFTTTMHHYPFR